MYHLDKIRFKEQLMPTIGVDGKPRQFLESLAAWNGQIVDLYSLGI